MAKTLTLSKYLRVIFSKFKTRVVDISVPYLLPKTRVFTSFEVGINSCFCTITRGGSYRIVFGGRFLKNMLSLPYDLDLPTMRFHFNDTQKAFRAIYYHEMGHLKFTAMHCTLINDYEKIEYRSALHNLFNILEDIVIERFCMSVNYKYTKKYFTFLESKLFNESTAADYKDNGKASGFFNFLLLKLRMKKSFTGYCKFAVEHPEYIEYVRSVLTEPKGVKRIQNTILFFEWLLEQGLEFDCDADCSSEIPFTSGKDDSSDVSEKGTAKSSKSFDSDSYGSRGEEPTVGEGDPSEAKKADELDDEEEDEEAKAYSEDDPVISDVDIEDSFVDALDSGDYDHLFYNVKDYFKINKDFNVHLQPLFDKMSPLATSIATKIKTFKVRIKPRYQKGYPSGRLHVPSAIEGKPVNIFQRKEDIGLKTDLSVYLLVDNSGSMIGRRSYIATEASIALSLACDQARIPCAVSMFTSNFDSIGATCVTYRIKGFKDDLSKVKQFFGVMHSDYYEDDYKFDTSNLPVFKGNIDEINLSNVAQEYRKEKYKDKVLIIISDGATCGSTMALKGLVSRLEKDFYILGIGANSNAPSTIYSNYKIFNSLDELSGLPDYIGEVLYNLARGKR